MFHIFCKIHIIWHVNIFSDSFSLYFFFPGGGGGLGFGLDLIDFVIFINLRGKNYKKHRILFLVKPDYF